MILMIDNYDSFTYNLVQEFGVLGADVKVARLPHAHLGTSDPGQRLPLEHLGTEDWLRGFLPLPLPTFLAVSTLLSSSRFIVRLMLGLPRLPCWPLSLKRRLLWCHCEVLVVKGHGLHAGLWGC